MAALIVFFSCCSSAQTPDADGKKGTPILFHVTSVRQDDDPAACPIAACSARKFTVEGYADATTGTRIAYVLTCDELMALKPTPRTTFSCGNVHANFDYRCRMFASSISFWPDGKYNPPPLHGLYEIMSEKEIGMPSK